MRWSVPVPLSMWLLIFSTYFSHLLRALVDLPHRLMEDDVYRGMHIPKGSLIFGNIWTILRDESMYPNADAFLPERFLEPAESPEIERKRNPLNYVFGFGRRCESHISFHVQQGIYH